MDSLRRIVRALRESSRAAEDSLGVSGAQLFALQALARTPNLSLNELAARTRTHQSTVSVVMKRLVEQGLVRRRTSASDGRRMELAVTRRGAALLERAPHAAQERLIAGIDHLPASERRVLASTLERLVAAMAATEGEATMFFEDEGPSRSRARSTRGKR
ncbi:MAG: MarR family transcriptional regulator [Polyangiaceae bacterium]|nr:MarR family transcriptional regulator [Polyangiaceae bacterium]